MMGSCGGISYHDLKPFDCSERIIICQGDPGDTDLSNDLCNISPNILKIFELPRSC